MELILVAGCALATVFGAAFANQLASEFRAWTPRIVARFIQRAVGNLPREHRARYEEEWHSHINETPGEISKIITATGFLFAAWQMRRPFDAIRSRIVDYLNRFVAATIIAAASPMFAIIAIMIKIDSAGPVFDKQQLEPTSSGRPVYLRTFRVRNFNGEPTRVGVFLARRSLVIAPMLLLALTGRVRFSMHGYILLLGLRR